MARGKRGAIPYLAFALVGAAVIAGAVVLARRANAHPSNWTGVVINPYTGVTLTAQQAAETEWL